jgi:tetratricopeptide (TPR) repeat protein/DNA-binding CsgD family transcriptional regulator
MKDSYIFSKLPAAFLAVSWLVLFSCEYGSNRLLPDQRDPEYAHQAEDNAAFQLNQQGDSATMTGDYPKAIALYQQSIDSAAAQADSFPYFDSKLDLANVYSMMGEQTKAIAIAEPVLEAFIRSGDTSRIGRTYSTLNIYYGRAGMTGKALEAAQKGFQLLHSHGSLIEQCAAYNQMAFTYSDAGDFEKALPLLDTALALMKASGVLDQLPSMLLNVGNCHRKLGHEEEAFALLQEAAHKADSLGQAHVRAKALERLSQLAESKGEYAGALTLFRESRQLMDSIFTEEKTRTIQQLELQRMELEKENEINQIKSKSKLTSLRFIYTLIVLALLLAIAGERLYRWQKKLKKSKEELALARQNLLEFTNLLREKNARLAQLEKEPPLLAAEKEVHDDFLYNATILTESDWAAFKTHYERAYPGFLFRLRNAFPELSGSEERLFLLLKLNFQRQEIASTLGISIDSVKKGRNRLRKRLGLKETEDLEEFVRDFK